MKTFVFPYYISFGKLDSVGGEIEYALSDKNAKRLERSARDGGRFRLHEDKEINDIYNRVYNAIIDFEKKQLMQDPTMVWDALDIRENHSLETPISEEQINRYLDTLAIGVNYPESLQMLETQPQKKHPQSKYESVVVENSFLPEYLTTPESKDKIIYLDEGKTLYYIPIKYSGCFVLPSNVDHVEKGTFKNHTRITEIIIEEGIQELPEWAFEGCSSLKKVTIPSTIKRIGFNTFTKCSSLQEVVLAEGVEDIDSTAFRFCESLEVLRLPSTIKTVNKYINAYNNGLKHLFFEGMETTIEGRVGESWRKMTMHVKKGSCAELYACDNSIHYVIEK